MKNHNELDHNVKKILDLPTEQRRKLKFVGLEDKDFNKKSKPRKKKNKNSRMTDEEILDIIRSDELINSNEYERVRKEGMPSRRTLSKRFGSWANLVKIVFGETFYESKVRARKELYTPEYMVRCVIDLDLWYIADFRASRRRNKDIIPPYYRVLEEFGCWGNLIQICRMQSLKCVLEDYRVLKRKLGKKPSLTECRKHRLGRVVELIDLYGNKKALDEYVARIDTLEARMLRS